MCYSAMVRQDAKKLGDEFGAQVQLDLYKKLFQRRLQGEKIYLNKAMELQFLNPGSKDEEQICESIREYRKQQSTELQQELFKQKKRLADAERTLESKTTKKAQNDQRIASKKIKKILRDLEGLGTDELQSETDERIFPNHYMSMLCLNSKGEKTIIPVRYLMRPHNKTEKFDQQFHGCYNARRDSLETVGWWQDSLVKRRGLILVQRFYENVDPNDYAKKHKLPKEVEGKKTMVLGFEPEDLSLMYIPTLWDYWKKGSDELFSAALITDDPAPEVAAAGHDRTPIFLKPEVVDDWLHESEPAKLQEILDQKQKPYYSHRVMGAA